MTRQPGDSGDQGAEAAALPCPDLRYTHDHVFNCRRRGRRPAAAGPHASAPGPACHQALRLHSPTGGRRVLGYLGTTASCCSLGRTPAGPAARRQSLSLPSRAPRPGRAGARTNSWPVDVASLYTVDVASMWRHCTCGLTRLTPSAPRAPQEPAQPGLTTQRRGELLEATIPVKPSHQNLGVEKYFKTF